MFLLRAGLVLSMVISAFGGNVLEKYHIAQSNNLQDLVDKSYNILQPQGQIPSNADGAILYLINAAEKYHSVNNIDYVSAGTLDYSANMSALYDGRSGDAFIINYQQHNVVYISGKINQYTWHACNESFEEWFKTAPCLIDLYQKGLLDGYSFDSESITDELSERINIAVASLSPDYNSQSQSLSTVMHISDIAANVLTTYLSGFEKVVGNIRVFVRGDLKWIVGLFQGLGDFYKNFGGIEALNRKNIHLDFDLMAILPTPFELLSYLIQRLSPFFDLGTILHNSFENEDNFFLLLRKLGGDRIHEFDGFILAISQIEGYLHNRVSFHNLLVTLQSYHHHFNPLVDVKSRWWSAIFDLQETLKKTPLKKPDNLLTIIKDSLEHKNSLTDRFPNLSKLLFTDIPNEKWRVGNVDMSAVSKALLNGESVNYVLELLDIYVQI